MSGAGRFSPPTEPHLPSPPYLTLPTGGVTRRRWEILLSTSGNGVGGPSKSSSPPGSGVSPSSDAPPGSDVSLISNAPARSGETGRSSCTGGTTITGAVSQVTSLVSIALFSRCSTRNDSRGVADARAEVEATIAPWELLRRAVAAVIPRTKKRVR